MNNQHRSSYAIVALLAALLFSFTVCLTASAAPSSALSHKFEPPHLPPVITLFDNTPLYPEPDESIEPWATLSPQDVNTIEAEKDWYLNTDGKAAGTRWIKIKTSWLGDLWMHLDYNKIGTVKPMDSNIALLWPAALYTQPTKSTMTDVVLAPQTVHANAVFESPVANRSYRIETWLGDQWLVDPNRILLDMTVLNKEMELPTETLYMDEYDTANRLQRPSDAKFIPAQKVFALEKTVNNEYHVRAADGSTFWINPAYAQPVGANKTNEIIELTKSTVQHLFPTMPFPVFGAISPQKVQAFEQWDDPQGHRWYRIHSWSGDMWIQP